MEIIENKYDLDFSITSVTNSIKYPTTKSNHFLIPLLVAKRFLETKNIFVYEKVLDCYKNNQNGTGRFFEALSNETIHLNKKTLVISFGFGAQHFGQVFAMGLQDVDYVHVYMETIANIIQDITKYEEIIFYINELKDEHSLLNVLKRYNDAFLNKNIYIACIVDFSNQNNVFSLFNIKEKDCKKKEVGIYKCCFPYHDNSIIQRAINNNATQDDNLIETIMTLMSTQDFTKTSDKIKILFLADDEFSYIPMLISEFMSGFDQYEIYFSIIGNKPSRNINMLSLNEEKEFVVNNIVNEDYEFLFYITQKNIYHNSHICEKLKLLNNIQNINILTTERRFI